MARYEIKSIFGMSVKKTYRRTDRCGMKPWLVKLFEGACCQREGMPSMLASQDGKP
jgi:hypothetical protein